MAERRKRAKAKPRRQLRAVPGEANPEYSGGLPAQVEKGVRGGRRFTRITVTSHPYDFLQPVGERYEEANLTGLARHLVSELQSYIRSGQALPRPQLEELREVILVYARQQQESRSHEIGWRLMLISVQLAYEKISTADALGAACGLRNERFWFVPGRRKRGKDLGDAMTLVTVDSLGLVVESRSSLENKAKELYRLLATGADAVPQPQEKLQRDNATELRRMLESCIEHVERMPSKSDPDK